MFAEVVLQVHNQTIQLIFFLFQSQPFGQLNAAHLVVELGGIAEGPVSAAAPLDLVLRLLLEHADSLQHVCDVIQATFLYLKLLRAFVQIHHTVGRCREQFDELLREQAEAGVVARHRLASYFLQRVLAPAVLRRHDDLVNGVVSEL